MAAPVIVVVGAGPGLGAALARRYGREGYAVALVARSPGRLEELGTALQAEGITAGWTAADLTDEGALRAAVTRFGGFSGSIDVLHYNPSVFRERDPLELTAAELLQDVHVGVGGLLTALQAARPFMAAGGRVSATGSMAADAPWHRAASLGVQKAALRNLVRSIDATLRPDGIRAVSVTVNGTLEAGTAFDPDRVAQALFDAARQPEESWRVELPYDG
ncbi:SDR family oxidoreductase [Nocardioides mesophilus]|uniref:SDR family oxidoreductase n=1 Tax=Nocardioides mesophilus TaxID=433659 RepID=A0A7G9R9Z4_9ACTN|nr:SDR family oxidoreductase [Nocardioides mesophilus]QNN52419.1 SDR family oxidoreductase [Nocardioides mesophilus]